MDIRDQETGWLARYDCDGMVWAGEYAASSGVEGVAIEAAEYPGSPGKFARRPPPYCWTKDGGDQGAKTEWSRDMGVSGLLPWAWRRGRLDVLDRHRKYGRDHNWFLGEPVADGSTYYTPEMRGLLSKTIEALGGGKDPDILWPDVWPSGLTDYEAHLQVMAIWLQGEVADKLGEGDAAPKISTGSSLDVSGTMFDRLKEHAEGEPRNPFFQYVYGRYTGDQAATLSLLLDPAMPVGSYVRCQVLEQCQLADWIFTTSLLLRDFGALD